MQHFLELQIGVATVQAIEYAETATHLIISFYIQDTEGKLCNSLVIFDLDGNLLLQEQLGSSLSGIGSDTFFIFKHNLFSS
ncbi:hypothetical protein GCM10028895_03930 [Pontibacter rugosus]